jgi:hypothetical protein
MRLSKVTYRVFEREAEGPWAAETTAWHQLDGEIMLTFTDGNREYISWGSEPEQYCVQRKNKTSFSPDTLCEVDMTEHPYWKELEGQTITHEFADKLHQVLVIRNGDNSVFLSSQYDDGTFLGDCVRVSKSNPL